MKKSIYKVLIIALGFFTAFSCSKPDNAIYDVFDGLEHGAVLRTLNRVNTNFNLFDMNSTFEIEVEEQDEQKGKLLSEVKVYLSYTDNVADGVDNNKTDLLASTIPASAFTTSANGLPSTTVSLTFAEALSALGLSAGQYAGGDEITVRLELVLTDGRTFSADDASGSLQGSYFQSPYAYSAGILCVPASPFPGDYVIDMQDSYGDGWQGSGIIVTIDGTATTYSVPDLWSVGAPTDNVGDPTYVAATATVTVPVGVSSLTFEWVSGSYPSECTFQITTPSGATGFEGGPSPVDGEIALNLCNE